ncbi:MAG: GAF domain-containing protein [Chloroflexi bacterium]|nr:GAF domain-containing protein [Chloroflexota bacterium]
MFVNEAVVRLTGFSREELLDPQSNHYTNYIDAAAITRLQDVFYAASQGTSASRTVEVMVRSRDGVTRPLEVSVSLVRDSYGQPQGIRGFVRLMTDPRILERALRASMQQLAMLQQVDTELNGYLDPSAILTVGLNAAMSLSRADTGFIALMESDGLRVVRSNGLGSGDHDRRLQLSEGVVGRALRTGRAQFVMDTRNDPDYVGDVPGMEANIVAPLIARDRVVGVLNLETSRASRFSHEVYEFVQLLTARLAISLDNALLMKTLQEQLTAQQKLYAQVADLEHLKTDMIRIAAHDMRSPLSVIANYITLLRGPGRQPDEAQRGYFDAISRGLDRLFRLSTDVLSLERIQEQHTRPSALVRSGSTGA